MYINKAKRKAITELLLTVKVKGKGSAREREANGPSALWHTMWDECEYAHKAVMAMLGDTEEHAALTRVAQYNDVARATMERMQ